MSLVLGPDREGDYLDLRDEDFFNEDFDSASLSSSFFKGCNFSSSSFRSSSFLDCTFVDCNLSSCDFSLSFFTRCKFVSCLFTGTFFTKTKMKDVKMEKCTFLYVSFDEGDMRNSGIYESKMNDDTSTLDGGTAAPMGSGLASPPYDSQLPPPPNVDFLSGPGDAQPPF